MAAKKDITRDGEMYVVDGVRYRHEDAVRGGHVKGTADDPETVKLQARVRELEEQLAQRDAEQKAATPANKARTPANKSGDGGSAR